MTNQTHEAMLTKRYAPLLREHFPYAYSGLCEPLTSWVNGTKEAY